jgi:hypothetical protein
MNFDFFGFKRVESAYTAHTSGVNDDFIGSADQTCFLHAANDLS